MGVLGFGSLGFRNLALNVLGVEWFWNFGLRVLVVFKVLAGLGGFGFSFAEVSISIGTPTWVPKCHNPFFMGIPTIRTLFKPLYRRN